jgi:hypothetical protein
MIEHYTYESRPYLFLLSGLAALVAGHSSLMTASAALLIATSAYVVYLRYQYRVIESGRSGR